MFITVGFSEWGQMLTLYGHTDFYYWLLLYFKCYLPLYYFIYCLAVWLTATRNEWALQRAIRSSFFFFSFCGGGGKGGISDIQKEFYFYLKRTNILDGQQHQQNIWIIQMVILFSLQTLSHLVWLTVRIHLCIKLCLILVGIRWELTWNNVFDRFRLTTTLEHS